MPTTLVRVGTGPLQSVVGKNGGRKIKARHVPFSLIAGSLKKGYLLCIYGKERGLHTGVHPFFIARFLDNGKGDEAEHYIFGKVSTIFLPKKTCSVLATFPFSTHRALRIDRIPVRAQRSYGSRYSKFIDGLHSSWTYKKSSFNRKGCFVDTGWLTMYYMYPRAYCSYKL